MAPYDKNNNVLTREQMLEFFLSGKRVYNTCACGKEYIMEGMTNRRCPECGMRSEIFSSRAETHCKGRRKLALKHPEEP
ncbi:MAG: hypothetical protein ABIG30_02100 [Candidatus Aenigmatarchaeota archaeon]